MRNCKQLWLDLNHAFMDTFVIYAADYILEGAKYQRERCQLIGAFCYILLQN